MLTRPSDIQEEAWQHYVDMIQLGVFAGYEENHVMSCNYFAQAAKMLPNYYLAHFLKSTALQSLFKMEQAVQVLEFILQSISISESIKLLCQAQLADLRKQNDTAMEYAQQAFELDATNNYAGYVFAICLVRKQKFEQAQLVLAQVYELPWFSKCSVCNAVGTVYHMMKQNSKTEEWYSKCIEIYPKNSTGTCNFALYYATVDQYDKAFELLKRVQQTHKFRYHMESARILHIQAKYTINDTIMEHLQVCFAMNKERVDALTIASHMIRSKTDKKHVQAILDAINCSMTKVLTNHELSLVQAAKERIRALSASSNAGTCQDSCPENLQWKDIFYVQCMKRKMSDARLGNKLTDINIEL